MGGFVFLFIVFIIGVIVYNFVKGQAANDAWTTAASRLNFSYEPGTWNSQKRMSGKIGDTFVMVHVFARGSGKSRRNYTGYRAEISQQLPARMRLEAQGMFSAVSRFFGAQDIEIGSKEFDEGVIIKGSNKQEIAEFLTIPRKVRILSLMRQFHVCEISNEGVFVANRGVESNPDNIIAILNRVADVAEHLTDEEVEPAWVEPPPLPKSEPAPPPIPQAELKPKPEPEPEPEIEVEFEDPEPPEPPAVPVAEIVPPEPPAAAEPEPKPEPTLEPEPAPAAKSEIERVCHALFLEASTRYEATRIFDSEFRGQTVRWSGVLQRVEEFSYDLVFKNGPGLIARFKLLEIEGHPYSLGEIKAAVQLPKPEDESAEPDLKSKLGETLGFSGRLEKCDPFAGILFVAEGEIIPRPA